MLIRQSIYLVIITIFIILFNIDLYSQSIADSLIVDIDGLIYKTLKREDNSTNFNTQYFDLKGKQRELYFGQHDSLEDTHLRTVFDIVRKEARFPSDYRINSDPNLYESTLRFTVSFLVEKDGSITNLRLIGNVSDVISMSDIFPNKFDLPKLKAVSINGETVVVERAEELVISCFCGPPVRNDTKNKVKSTLYNN